VCISLLAIYWIHYNMESTRIGHFNQWYTSAMTAVQIFFFVSLYRPIARYLTETENHRTEEAFYDAYVIKVFSFQFLVTSLSFYYWAFVAPHHAKWMFSGTKWGRGSYNEDIFHDCGYYTCLGCVGINLIMVTAINIFCTFFYEFGPAEFIMQLPMDVITFLTTPVYTKTPDYGTRIHNKNKNKNNMRQSKDTNDYFSSDQHQASWVIEGEGEGYYADDLLADEEEYIEVVEESKDGTGTGVSLREIYPHLERRHCETAMLLDNAVGLLFH
jgi:hypothetical protein